MQMIGNKNEYDIPHEHSLMMNFFNGDVYFVFENQDEAASFLDYIKNFDQRFSENEELFKMKNKMKAAAWIYSKFLHRSQMEWADSIEYFGERYLMKPVSYSIVREHAETATRLRKLSDAFRELLPSDGCCCSCI